MLNALKKLLFSLLIFVVPCINSSSKAMDNGEHTNCNYVHKHTADKDKINAIYISKSSRHSFPQKNYTYSFPICDEDDVDVLNTLEVDIYAQYTIGTYSISIDYTDSKDPYVHRKTGYLVRDDLESTTEAMPYGKKVAQKNGRILFHSKKPCAPQCLNPNDFININLEDDNSFSNKGNFHHMENSLLPALCDNNKFFKRIREEIPLEKTILGICIKIYSSYDFCGDCRANILTLAPYLHTQFSKNFQDSHNPPPLTILGLIYRPYGHDYCGAKGVALGDPGYGTDIYPQDKFLTFNGRINGSAYQAILPIYIYIQPKKSQDKNLTLTFT